MMHREKNIPHGRMALAAHAPLRACNRPQESDACTEHGNGSAFWLRITGCGALLLLAACNPLGAPKAPDAVYVLRAAEGPAEVASAPIAQTVKIALPEAAPGLESAQMMLLEGHRLNHYTGAAWAAPLPQSIQNLLADAFQRSGRFRAVGTDAEGITSDITLLTDIRDWQVEGGVVHVRAVLKVTQSASRIPIGTTPFEVTIPTENRTEAIVDAFNRAADQFSRMAITAVAAAAPTPPLSAPVHKK